MGTGRIVGGILVAVAAVVLLGSAALLAVQVQQGETTAPGAVLGLLLVLVVAVLPLGGGGVYLLFRGRQEAAELARIRKQRKLLDAVLAQGELSFAAAALELDIKRAEVEDHVRELVGKQLFSGAVNWRKQVLYSREAHELKAGGRCPHCGGDMKLAGKGLVHCAHCGADVFLLS